MTRPALAAWVRALGLLAVAAGLWIAGRAALPAPPVHRPDQLVGWAEPLGPAGVAMALVRVGTVATAALLGTATVLHLLARCGGAGRLAALADRLVPAAARRVAHGLAGVSLTAGLSVAGAAAPSPATGPPAVAGSHATTSGTDSTSGTAGTRVAGPHLPNGPAPLVHRLPGGPATSTQAAPDDPGTASLRALPDEPGPSTATLRSLAGTDDRWTVEAGDSFWSIATDRLAEAWARPPATGEVAAYWATLIEANRHRLVTGDPDLLYPGQELHLPPLHR